MRDLFIKTLSSQPLYNQGRIETKINIHIPIRGDLSEYCIIVNDKIKSITNTEIDFGYTSFQIPHITLYMGYLRSEELYGELFKRLHEYSKRLHPFDITFSKPYLKKPKGNYLFLDTDQGEMIIKLKQEIKEILDDLIAPLDWDVVNEPPHLTLAYINAEQHKIEDLLKNIALPSKLNANAIEVSFCGPRGSCLGTIKSIDF